MLELDWTKSRSQKAEEEYKLRQKAQELVKQQDHLRHERKKISVLQEEYQKQQVEL